jgi:hypothetical protein
MRFCPFCSAENAEDQAVCQACGRRLPPLPPRRAQSRTGAPPTGITLPPRAASSTQGPPTGVTPAPARRAAGSTHPPPIPAGGRRASTTMPPPIPAAAQTPPRGARATSPPPMSGAPASARPATLDEATRGLDERRESMGGGGHAGLAGGAGGNAPRGVDEAWADPGSIPGRDPAAELRNALEPSPAAERRPPPPAEPRAVGEPARRRADAGPAPIAPTAFARPGPSRPPPIAAAGTPAAATPAGPAPPRPPAPAAPPVVAPPVIAPARERAGTSGIQPPPTRIHRPEGLADRPFTPPKVAAIPEIPEPGLVQAARYAYQFAIARWQRRGAIKQLGVEIKQDTEALDQVLGALGRAARGARVEGRVFSAENAAITAAEERIAALEREAAEVDARKAEENSKFGDVERERTEKLAEAERMVEEVQRELSHLEAQRRGLRDKRKDVDRRIRNFVKFADDHERQASSATLGDQRAELRRVAEGHRKEAAALEPERQELDRKLAHIERPIGEATARLDAAKAELDAAKRSLGDAREGHTHRLAELDAEHKRKAREVALAEAEIQRRLVTLGTLVNLNRIEDPQFAELYERIDRLRGAITARTTEIERLTAEREAYDRGTLVRGVATIGGAFVALIALIVILRAII